ncbi:NAD-dependent epimerase/dehydratase family protein [Bacteroidia bacterium]|nr:NAD-dependent epimerase/dehydratase family protein [Bacteroidia bacterium]
MKVLVTGADGLLGSNLVRLLIEKNHQVSVLLHPSSNSTSLDGLNITQFKGDILKPETLLTPMQECDAVIHAAANTSVWPARSEMVNKVNIEGTQNMIKSALESNIKRFVYIGSGSSVNTPKSEGSKYDFPGQKFGLDYIDSKHTALNLVMEASKKNGLSSIAILPTFMIGAYDSLPSSGKLIQTLAKGKLKFYSGGGRNFVYVNDVAHAIVNGLESTIDGDYFVAGGVNMSYKEYFDKVSKIVGMPAPSIKMPNALILLSGWFGSAIAQLTKKPPLISKEVARISCVDQFMDSSRAIKELNMPQTSIDLAIQKCYDWFKENDYV